MFDAVWRPIQRGIGFGQGNAQPRRSLIGFVKKFLNDWSLVWSAVLAYTFIVSLLPLFVTAFGILGFIFRANSSVRQTIIDAIVDAQPNATQEGIRQVTEIAMDSARSGAGGIFAIGIIFSLWGGSRLFATMDDIFTIIYRTRQRGFLKKNLLAIGMLILFIILIVFIVVSAGVPSFLINVLPDSRGAQFGIFVAGIVLSITVAFVLFLLIYLIIPNKPIRFKYVLCGALLAAILLDIFLILFPLYIRRFMGSFVGLIGFAVILIAFFYYFGLIIILGAQINAYFFDRIQQFPDGLGTFVSEAFERLVRRAGPIAPVINQAQYPPRPRPAYVRRPY